MNYLSEDPKEGQKLYLKLDAYNSQIMTEKEFQYWLKHEAINSSDLYDTDIMEVEVKSVLEFSIDAKPKPPTPTR